MNYELEELVPIVAKLAEGYTSKESTSITYDRAQQFMEAVLYSIHEGEKAGQLWRKAWQMRSNCPCLRTCWWRRFHRRKLCRREGSWNWAVSKRKCRSF